MSGYGGAYVRTHGEKVRAKPLVRKWQKRKEEEREKERGSSRCSTRITQSSRETMAIRRSTVSMAELSACLDSLVARAHRDNLRHALANTCGYARTQHNGAEYPRKQAADYLSRGIPIAGTIGANWPSKSDDSNRRFTARIIIAAASASPSASSASRLSRTKGRTRHRGRLQ